MTEFRKTTETILTVRDLHVSFASEAGTVRAVSGVSFDLQRGKTLGIVGESGSGKSVTSMAIMGLLDKNAKVEGSIEFEGENLLEKNDAQMSKLRDLRLPWFSKTHCRLSPRYIPLVSRCAKLLLCTIQT